jgi:hypothetical protein
MVGSFSRNPKYPQQPESVLNAEESSLLGLASNCSNGVLVLRLQGLPLRLHIELVSQALPLRLRLWPGVGLRATAFRFIKEKACP